MADEAEAPRSRNENLSLCSFGTGKEKFLSLESRRTRADSANEVTLERSERRARDFCGNLCSRRARTHAHTHAVIAIGRLTNQRGERIAVPILHAVSPRVSRARASSFYRIGRPQGTGGEGERVALPGEQGSQWIRISRSSGGIVRRLFLFLSSPRRFFRRSSPLLGAEAVSRSPLHPSAGIFYAHAWICL